MIALSERTKLALLCLLLILTLWILCLTVVNTYRAVQNFQQQNSALEAGDVSTIHDWMTIHVISHIYHVPEDYLESTLQIASPQMARHATLSQIASHKRQPVAQVIQSIQHAILEYRKHHHPRATPTTTPVLRTPRTSMRPHAQATWRREP